MRGWRTADEAGGVEWGADGSSRSAGGITVPRYGMRVL